MPQLVFTFLLGAFLAACSSTSSERLRIIPAGHDGEYTIWWNDERPKEHGTAKEGRRHGEVVRYHPDGSPALRGNFAYGLPDGHMEQLYPNNGGVQLVEQRVAGTLEGARKEYFPEDGGLRRRTPFSNGLREGLEEGWHANGALAIRRSWHVGLGSGLWEEFDPEGSLLRTEHRWLADGKEVGYLETVYTGTDRVSIQTLMRRHAGVWSGWETVWHENGVQAGYVEYAAGRRHGLDQSWSRSGQLVVEGWRVEDKRHGTWRTWSDGGALLEVLEYNLGDVLEPADSAEG